MSERPRLHVLAFWRELYCPLGLFDDDTSLEQAVERYLRENDYWNKIYVFGKPGRIREKTGREYFESDKWETEMTLLLVESYIPKQNTCTTSTASHNDPRYEVTQTSQALRFHRNRRGAVQKALRSSRRRARQS